MTPDAVLLAATRLDACQLRNEDAPECTGQPHPVDFSVVAWEVDQEHRMAKNGVPRDPAASISAPQKRGVAEPVVGFSGRGYISERGAAGRIGGGSEVLTVVVWSSPLCPAIRPSVKAVIQVSSV
ncbi:hypothetical protein C8J57DRAFT_1242497 [Mycena rebaudengoi]|nr:hypothetical protein C8J57DRAFT_1242497 [Mycena rebaudengoi]